MYGIWCCVCVCLRDTSVSSTDIILLSSWFIVCTLAPIKMTTSHSLVGFVLYPNSKFQQNEKQCVCVFVFHCSMHTAFKESIKATGTPANRMAAQKKAATINRHEIRKKRDKKNNRMMGMFQRKDTHSERATNELRAGC